MPSEIIKDIQRKPFFILTYLRTNKWYPPEGVQSVMFKYLDFS